MTSSEVIHYGVGVYKISIRKDKEPEEDSTDSLLRVYEGTPKDRTNSSRHPVWKLKNFLGKHIDVSKQKTRKIQRLFLEMSE